MRYIPPSLKFGIEPAMKGILVTCQRHNESKCKRELMELLEEVRARQDSMQIWLILKVDNVGAVWRRRWG